MGNRASTLGFSSTAFPNSCDIDGIWMLSAWILSRMAPHFFKCRCPVLGKLQERHCSLEHCFKISAANERFCACHDTQSLGRYGPLQAVPIYLHQFLLVMLCFFILAMIVGSDYLIIQPNHLGVFPFEVFGASRHFRNRLLLSLIHI